MTLYAHTKVAVQSIQHSSSFFGFFFLLSSSWSCQTIEINFTLTSKSTFILQGNTFRQRFGDQRKEMDAFYWIAEWAAHGAHEDILTRKPQFLWMCNDPVVICLHISLIISCAYDSVILQKIRVNHGDINCSTNLYKRLPFTLLQCQLQKMQYSEPASIINALELFDKLVSLIYWVQ